MPALAHGRHFLRDCPPPRGGRPPASYTSRVSRAAPSIPIASSWHRAGPHLVHARGAGEAAAGASPLLLVHGLGVSSRSMAPLLRTLARDGVVWAPDLPGFGKSSRPDRALDVDELADALARWMDAAAIARADVAGNSLGAQVALALADRHPGRAGGLVLVGPTMDPTRGGPFGQALRLALDAPREPIALVGSALLDYLRAGPRRCWATLEAALRDRPLDRAARLRAPLLVLRGARDPIASLAFSRALAAASPRGACVEIPAAAHGAHFSAPERVGSLIREFLRAGAGAARAAP